MKFLKPFSMVKFCVELKERSGFPETTNKPKLLILKFCVELKERSGFPETTNKPKLLILKFCVELKERISSRRELN
jgi:hypothetical protein